MNILLKGYLDRNFGDDLMIRLTTEQFLEHNFYIDTPKRELLLPFAALPNLFLAADYPEETMDAVLLVTGSGFILRNRLGTAMRAATLMRQPHKKLPTFAIGCNVGPCAGKTAQVVVDTELKRYQMITVRDSASYRYIKAYWPKKQVMCYPDILFSLPDDAIPEKTGEDCLGITAYRQLDKDNLHYYNTMARVADDYIAATGKKVILFAMDVEGENDLSAAYTILSLIEQREMVEICAHLGNGDNIIRNFARCKTVISARFHGCVLAMRMGIPLIPVIYSAKTTNLLSDIGFNGRYFHIDQVDAQILSPMAIGELPVFLVGARIFEMAKGHFNALREALESIQGK